LYSGVVKRAALLLLLCSFAAHPAAAQEAIYIVRHAERVDQSPDSELSTEGVGRSYKLRDMLRDAGITRIYTSELRRTIETAAPLATSVKAPPQEIPGGDPTALAAKIAASDIHDRLLVVGHSNTIPALLKALHVETPIRIGDDEYDNLFIVIPRTQGGPVLLRLKY
jgi:phosphohistidine phosphatase SixA